MNRFLFVVGLLCISVGGFGLSYTYTHDHRQAETLTAYCDVDFRTSFAEDGSLEGAVLTLLDYRYDRARLLGRLVVYTDNSPWEMTAKVKSRALAYDDPEHPLQHENKLFAELPRASLSSLKKCSAVRVRFYYLDGADEEAIDLPLSDGELAKWQMLME